MRNDFAVFILSHGRANNVKTIKAIIEAGYSGKWYVVIDDEDKQGELYKLQYKDHVLVFNKGKISTSFDEMDIDTDRRTVVYARNACFDLAQQIGVRYFLELDDDYTSFYHLSEYNYRLKRKKCKKFDLICDAFVEFLNESNAKTVCFSQAGDFICGTDNPMWRAKLHRKAMNAFFCDTENRFNFIGRINEDVNTYTTLGQRGELLFSVAYIMLNQDQTQTNRGGMTDIYIDNGTYIKSFFSVICSPSCVTVELMGAKNKRIHHNVHWNNCTPMILSERFQKR